MTFEMGRDEREMPAEMLAIIEQVFGESSALRQNLLGQLLGILTGEGPMEWIPGGGGYMETYVQPGHYTGGQGNLWVPEEIKEKWIPVGEEEGKWEPSGEPGIQIPIIAQAQEAQRRAASQALGQTEAGLAQRGLMGTPFGENILATIGQRGRQQVAGVEQNIIQQFLQMIPGMVTGNIQSIMGALPGTQEQNAWNIGGGYQGSF